MNVYVLFYFLIPFVVFTSCAFQEKNSSPDRPKADWELDLILNETNGMLVHKGIRLAFPHRFLDLMRGTQFVTSTNECNITALSELSICIQPDSKSSKTIQIEYFKIKDAQKENILAESINSGLFSPVIISASESLSGAERVEIQFDKSGALHATIKNNDSGKRYYLVATRNGHHIWIFQSFSISNRFSNRSILEDFSVQVKISDKK